jgi:molybdopterin-guanine dinucleotide biosynthesis protein A
MGGGDKTLLDLCGKPLLAHVIARLSPQTATIAISANGDPARLAIFDLPVIADRLPDFPGPLGGIEAGMRWAQSAGAERLLTVSGDSPFFPATLAAHLNQAAENTGIAVAASRERLHPTFALWPVDLADSLTVFLATGRRRVLDFLELSGYRAVPFEDIALPGGDVDPFFNVNQPSDLAEAWNLLCPPTK